MKLCKDCRHVRPSHKGAIDENAKCAKSGPCGSPPVNPVTGEEYFAYAQNERESTRCGPKAIAFEARP